VAAGSVSVAAAARKEGGVVRKGRRVVSERREKAGVILSTTFPLFLSSLFSFLLPKNMFLL
jgi:hypothetical protein